MMNPLSRKALLLSATVTLVAFGAFYSCTPSSGANDSVLVGNAASKVYVAPGKYDEYYAFLSGGYNGQVMAYGLPSGRLLKLIGVFSQNPETGYGYNEETKPMLQTTNGSIPWAATHN